MCRWGMKSRKATFVMENSNAFRDAAAKSGVPKIDDFNRGDNEDTGHFDVNQKHVIR